MKLIKFIFIIFLAVSLLVGIMSCGNKEKDKALKYIKELNEYIKSSEFKTLTSGLPDAAIISSATGEKIFDNSKFNLDFQNILDKKRDEIAKKAGFKDFKEADLVLDKLKEDKEIKEQTELFKNEFKNIQEQLEKEGLKKVENMKQNIEQEEVKQNFNPETGEVYDDETTIVNKSKDKVNQSDKKDSKEPSKNKKETKEIPIEKKENKQKPVEKPNNGKVEHPEDNLP